MALSASLARLSRETLPSVLFAEPPIVRFAPDRDTCSRGGSLLVRKTRRKKAPSMIGPFIAHETVAQCDACSSTFHSDALLRLAASRCNVAYDVLVFVGQALFRRHRSSREVRAELIARNIRLSTSDLAYPMHGKVTVMKIKNKQTETMNRRVSIKKGCGSSGTTHRII